MAPHTQRKARSLSERRVLGQDLREPEKIGKNLPMAKWLLESVDFFKKKYRKPKWNDQTQLFRNEGMCANARSYFDRWRDLPSNYLPNVGNLRSTWLIDNLPNEDMDEFGNDLNRVNRLQSHASRIINAHVHDCPTPRQKYLMTESLAVINKDLGEVQRPDIIAGSTYGSKYNHVAHANFREYFGKHRKHGKLDDNVKESHAAIVRSSLIDAWRKSGKLEQIQADLSEAAEEAGGGLPRNSVRSRPSQRVSIAGGHQRPTSRDAIDASKLDDKMRVLIGGGQKRSRSSRVSIRESMNLGGGK